MRNEVGQARRSMLLTEPGRLAVAKLLTLIATWISFTTIEASAGGLEVIGDAPTIGAANVNRPFDPEMRLFRDTPPLFQRLPTIGAVNA